MPLLAMAVRAVWTLWIEVVTAPLPPLSHCDKNDILHRFFRAWHRPGVNSAARVTLGATDQIPAKPRQAGVDAREWKIRLWILAAWA